MKNQRRLSSAFQRIGWSFSVVHQNFSMTINSIYMNEIETNFVEMTAVSLRCLILGVVILIGVST